MKPTFLSKFFSLALLAGIYLVASSSKSSIGQAMPEPSFPSTIDQPISSPSDLIFTVDNHGNIIIKYVNSTTKDTTEIDSIPMNTYKLWYTYQDTTKAPYQLHFVDSLTTRKIMFGDSNAFSIDRDRTGFLFKLSSYSGGGKSSYIGIGEGDLRNGNVCTHQEFNINNLNAKNISNYIEVMSCQSTDHYLVIEQSHENKTSARALINTTPCSGTMPDSVCISSNCVGH